MRSLEREQDMAVLWDVGSIAGLEERLAKIPVDVVMVDLNLGPNQDALGAVTRIRKRHETVKVIVISGSLDWEAAAAARRAGANGYLPKDLAVADIVAAIRGLSSPNFGRTAFQDMSSDRNRGNGKPVALRSKLTRRQQEVLGEL